MEKNNKKSDYDFLTESIVNISKAGAYDIVSKQRDELVEQNKKMYELLCFANSSLSLSKDTLNRAGGQNLVDTKHKIETFLNNYKH